MRKIPKERICISCKTIRPKSEFYRFPQHVDGLRHTCIPCMKAYDKKRYKKKSKQSHINQLMKWYGLSLEDYEKMYSDRKGKCDICGIHKPPRNYKYGAKPHMSICVDHNHKTGKVRGLLCFQCNFALGNFKDDIELVRSAVRYLEENNV